MGASALLYCKKIQLNNNDNVCCDYKTKITLSVVTHTYTIANAVVPMKLRPILTGQSQITACERKLLFVKET